jgi:hypothetical protein
LQTLRILQKICKCNWSVCSVIIMFARTSLKKCARFVFLLAKRKVSVHRAFWLRMTMMLESTYVCEKLLGPWTITRWRSDLILQILDIYHDSDFQ